MTKHFERELDVLKRDILTMGIMVEESLTQALRALATRDAELAEQVIRADEWIDARENKIDEECLKLLALYQPAASDLRFITAVMKINGDLERMADETVNIAERAAFLAGQPKLAVDLPFDEMQERVRKMVKECLDALVNRDAALARSVCAADDAVDDLNRRNYSTLLDVMRKDPAGIERGVMLLSVSRFLERIADLATNVSEDVVYFVEGEIIRHHGLHDPTTPPPSWQATRLER